MLLKYIIEIIKAWLGFKQTSAEHTGSVIEQNKVLAKSLELKEEQLKALENEPSLEDSLRTGKF